MRVSVPGGVCACLAKAITFCEDAFCRAASERVATTPHSRAFIPIDDADEASRCAGQAILTSCTPFLPLVLALFIFLNWALPTLASRPSVSPFAPPLHCTLRRVLVSLPLLRFSFVPTLVQSSLTRVSAPPARFRSCP